MSEQRSERAIGIDVLRILLAFMVLTLHFNGSSTGQVLQYVEILPNKLWALALEALCYPAVNCYVIISGYFSFQARKSITAQFSSLIKLYMAVLSYSVLGYFVAVLLGEQFVAVEFVKRFIPLTTGQWWYMSCYFALMCISPYINKLIVMLSLSEHKMLLAIMIFPLCVMPFFNKLHDSIGVDYGYSIIWFFCLYITGAYLARNNYTGNKIRFLLSYLSLSIILQGFSLFSSRIVFLQGFSFAAYNSIVVYFQAICLVMLFLHLKVSFLMKKRIRKLIIETSSLSMSLYLFHCQVDIEKILWRRLNLPEICNTWIYIPLFITVSLGLFLLSCSMEWIRRKVFSSWNFENIVVKRIILLLKRIKNALLERF